MDRMRIRPTWLAVSFVLGFGVLGLCVWFSRQRDARPATFVDAEARITSAGLFYFQGTISRAPLSMEEADLLSLNSPRAAWQGKARLYSLKTRGIPEFLHGRLWGNFLVVGDHDLVEEIAALR